MVIEYWLPIISLIVSVSSIIWTVWFNLSKENESRINRVIELQFQYNSDEMYKARELGWYLFDNIDDVKKPWNFEALWGHPDELVRRRFDSLYKVLFFWLTLYHLGNEGKIDKTLAKDVFSYEYRWWYHRVQPLISDSIECNKSADRLPDVVVAFKNEGISWLPKPE